MLLKRTRAKRLPGGDDDCRCERAIFRETVPEKEKAPVFTDATAPPFLSAQTQRGQHFLIALAVGAGKVIKKLATTGDHAEKSAARRNVFLVGRQVAGEMVDATGEQCDLDVRTTGIAIMELETSGGVA